MYGAEMAIPLPSDHGAPSAYPMKCPACAAMRGNPVRVTTVKGQSSQFDLDIYCTTCGHRWDVLTGALTHCD